MNNAKIKNLIFDLGGVIIDIDPELTFKALSRKGNLGYDNAKDLFASSGLFSQYEKGLVNDEEFNHGVRNILNLDNKEWKVDEDWNSLLLEMPLKRIKLLQSLKHDYRLFLLSNTNPIHIKRVNEILKEVSGFNDLSDLFDKVYYSYQMNLSKPDEKIFLRVLRENSLNPKETLFIDDTYENISSAEKLNIRTLHVTSKNTLFDYFGYEQ